MVPLRNLLKKGTIIVRPALPDGKFPKFSASETDLQDRLLIVYAVDSLGKIAPFEKWNPEVVWAPGQTLTYLPGDPKPMIYFDSGVAAAVAAGLVARLLDRYPKAKPSSLVEVLRKTSRPAAPDGPPVLNLDAALAELAKNPPPLLTN